MLDHSSGSGNGEGNFQRGHAASRASFGDLLGLLGAFRADHRNNSKADYLA